MTSTNNSQRALANPWFWISLAIFGIGAWNVSNQYKFWPRSHDDVASPFGVAILLLEGLAVAGATSLTFGLLVLAVARALRPAGKPALITGCVLGFNTAVIALFWLLPMHLYGRDVLHSHRCCIRHSGRDDVRFLPNSYDRALQQPAIAQTNLMLGQRPHGDWFPLVHDASADRRQEVMRPTPETFVGKHPALRSFNKPTTTMLAAY